MMNIYKEYEYLSTMDDVKMLRAEAQPWRPTKRDYFCLNFAVQFI